MAFHELPKIDRPAINSDQSVKDLITVLNMGAGFILRVDVPDFGCDFDIELINKQSDASNWRFPLQLKSIENISLVQDGQFLSYSFKTSRLGYLIRRQPACGLVVLYDVKKKALFYDYADLIYLRLMEERGSDDWKVNDHVNILVPAANILNAQSAEEIHKKFIWRFEQGTLMQSSHGAKYGLPAINLEPKSGYDFNNLDDVKKALKKMGMSLLLQFDLQIVFDLISTLPAAQIVADKELCLIALIAFAEAGKYADSTYYIERVRKRYDLTADEKHSVDFMELKNQLSLGDLSPRNFIDKCREMLPKQTGTNVLLLKINILFFELSLVKALEPMPLHLGQDAQNLFFEIEDAPIDDLQKQYLKLWNAENMERWIGHFRSEGFAEMQLRETMGRPLTLEERLDKAQTLVKVHSMFYMFLNSIDKKAKETKNLLLQAHVIKLLIRFELSFQIDQIAHEMPVSDGPHDSIAHKVQLAEHGIQVFLNNSLFNNAYLLLLYLIDLIYVLRSRYGLAEDYDLDALFKLREATEKEFEFDGELAIPALLKRKEDQKSEKGSNLSFLTGLNDSQLDTLAEVMVQSTKYPGARKEHIVGEMKSHQLFNARCTNPNISVEQVLVSDAMAYAVPVSYILKNRLTNLISTPHSDMDKLLNSWGF
jgi:hypothetical protein